MISSICSQAFGQSSSLVVCLNKTTQRITVKSSCARTETLVCAKNLSSTEAASKPTTAPTLGSTSSASSFNYADCYKTSARKSGSTFDGRIAVGLLCKQSSDLLLNDQFATSDSSGAKPVLESKRLVINAKVPSGVEYGFLASARVNKFYEVQVSAVCCPAVSR